MRKPVDFRSSSLPHPQAEALYAQLNPSKLGEIPGVIRRIIQVTIGNAVIMNAALSDHLQALPSEEQERLRQKLFELFQVRITDEEPD